MSKKFTLGNDKASALQMLQENVIRKVQVGDHVICLFRRGENVYAFQPLCPHQSASLADGKVNKFDELICPLHHYRFDLHTGDVRSGDCGPLKIFPTTLTEKGIEISI
jgi:nitrite reductase/ring-hydroxylating ferredoxin subunit